MTKTAKLEDLPQIDPEEHFSVALETHRGVRRLRVDDIGYEDRAVMLIETEYRHAFLEQSKMEIMRSGLRSYFEKSWSAGGKAGVAKKVLAYSVAAATFTTLTVLSGGTLAVVLGVGAGAFILKKAGNKALDKSSTGSVEKRLKKLGDPDAPDSKSASAVLPVMIEHGGVAKIIDNLSKAWFDLNLFAERYNGKSFTPKEVKKRAFLRQTDALNYFNAGGRTELWREWQVPEKQKTGEQFKYNRLKRNQKDKEDVSRWRHPFAATKLRQNTVQGQTATYDFMRLKIKKLTYYNACLLDWCKNFRAEHARLHETVATCWDDMTSLVMQQTHLCGNHAECKDARCYGGFGILRSLAQAKGLEEYLDDETTRDLTAAAEPTGALDNAEAVDPAQAGANVSRSAHMLHGKLFHKQLSGKKLKVAKLAVKKAISKAAGRGVNAATSGSLDPLFDNNDDEDVTRKAARDAAQKAVSAIASGQAPNAAKILSASVNAPVVPCLGQIAADLTALLFSHYRENIGAREQMQVLTEGVLGDTSGVPLRARVMLSTLEKADAQNNAFFISQLPDALNTDLFKDELKAVGAKIDHYVKKGDRRKAKFAKLYEHIVSRAAESGTPPAFKNCKEASELAYHFFNMLKTLWKLEQHIMFLQVFAQGVACSLKEAATAARPPLQGTSTIPDGPAYFPHEAATGLDQWFHFWRQVPLPQPPAAPAATTPNSSQDSSSSSAGSSSSSVDGLSSSSAASSASSSVDGLSSSSAASSASSSVDGLSSSAADESSPNSEEPPSSEVEAGSSVESSASSIEELPDSDESVSHGWSDDEPDDQPRR